MRYETEWGSCPYCGGSALVTWMRTSTERGSTRFRSELRVTSHCLDPDCRGHADEPV